MRYWRKAPDCDGQRNKWTGVFGEGFFGEGFFGEGFFMKGMAGLRL
ncbi:MAG: hypothetical protein IMF26_02980 [Candidatus Fermentithermobacillus carboniphilus]|uniref:Uncharacterized protein n=1 Tax=Candidatus Fermentithermobacillus carboniphilus TaxID=3085328 RepID=A0AAT9LFW1_9FIRM|nr:MAG: hypothetical protein IMF26_02980 [Candidatus Fermentithermobacillus carboniphilus]